MRRPTDQAKVLFLYLLRSSAALATKNTGILNSIIGSCSSKVATSTPLHSFSSRAAATDISGAIGGGVNVVSNVNMNTASSSVSVSSSSSILPVTSGQIHLRMARRSDVPAIDRCNRATLPENYGLNFYNQFLLDYPELAIVAEHVPDGHRESAERESDSPSTCPPMLSNEIVEPDIVAYVLGRCQPPPSRSQRSRQGSFSLGGTHFQLDGDESTELLDSLNENGENRNQPELLGHVTSLAVMEEHRRKGLAAALMEQLHCHLSLCYGSNACGLHVRVSNEAACRLYEQDGYLIDNTIPHYYLDGEDAYFMKKLLDTSMFIKGDAGGKDGNGAGAGADTNVDTGRMRFGNWMGQFQKNKPWLNGPESRSLPRTVYPAIAETEEEEKEESYAA